MNNNLEKKKNITKKRKNFLYEYEISSLSETDYNILVRDFKYITQNLANNNFTEALHGLEHILGNEKYDFKRKLPENIIKGLENQKTLIEYYSALRNKIFENNKKLNEFIKNLETLVKKEPIKSIKVNYNNIEFDFFKLKKEEIVDIMNKITQGRHYFNNGYLDRNIKILNEIKIKYGDKLPVRYFDVLLTYKKVLEDIIQHEDKTKQSIINDNTREGKVLYEKHKKFYKILSDVIRMASELHR